MISLSARLFPVLLGFNAFGAPEVDFARDVQGILHARCAQCHGASAPQAGLSVITRAGLLKGGQSGPAIVPGSSGQSLLIRRVTGQTSPAMPMAGEPLSAGQIESLKAWIDQGAVWQPETATKPMPSLTLDPPPMPANSSGNPVDDLLESYFRKHNFAPPPLVSDEIFVRRAYLDLWGLLPTPEERQAFLRDQSTGKRARLVDQLLASRKNYAEHWISYWNDLLRNEEGVQYPGTVRKSITPWLREALENNVSYDRMVTALLSPAGKGAPEGFLIGVNWGGDESASQTAPMQAAQNSAQVFLGINLKCASCHDSFVSRWKLRESYGLASFFSTEPLDIYRCDVKTGQKATLSFLFPELMGTESPTSLAERRALAARLFVTPRNGRFARTLVNRIWKRLFDRGLIEPVDDMESEAWDADLLEWLASDFVNNGYDLQFLLRRITSSTAYQLPAVRLAADSRGNYAFEGPLYRRLTAEQFMDAVSSITGEWGIRDEGGTGKAVFARNWMLASDRLSRGLGRPIRDQVYTERNADATTLQALELINGSTLSDFLSRGARRLSGEWKPAPANLFDSGVVTKNKASLDVDIRGAKQLWLITEDAGTRDPGSVIAGWSEAILEGPRGSSRLVDLAGPEGVRKGNLQVNGNAAMPALLTSLPSIAVYDIAAKNYTRFRAFAGVDESSQKPQIGPKVRFFVFSEAPDRKRLIRVNGDPPVPVRNAHLPPTDLVNYLYQYSLGRMPAPAE